MDIQIEQFSRTRALIGKDALTRLANARVAVFGVGGVGGYVVEALARSGVGALDLIDNDVVSESNLNRQIIALHSTLGQAKVDVAAARVKDINPDCTVQTHKCFFLPETADQFDFSAYDYVVDAVDTVTAKLQIVQSAQSVGVPVISSMGAGNKLDPTAFRVADIYQTSTDKLAKVMRRECKKRGIRHLKVVYSMECTRVLQYVSADCGGAQDCASVANTSPEKTQTCTPGGAPIVRTPASIAFVPSACGLVIASEVVKDITDVTR